MEMEVQEELKYLRKKVNKLESTIQFIQNELQTKLGSVLERFFDQRASQLAKQKRAIQIEEDFCLDLLSCCADLQEADSRFEGRINTMTTTASVGSKRMKTESITNPRRKRGRTNKSKNRRSQKDKDSGDSSSSNDYSDGTDGDHNNGGQGGLDLDYQISSSEVTRVISDQEVVEQPEAYTIKTETEAAADLINYDDDGDGMEHDMGTTKRQEDDEEEEDVSDKEDEDYLAGRKRRTCRPLKWKLVLQLFDTRSAAEAFIHKNWARHYNWENWVGH